MSQYFPKPFINFGENINVKVNLSDYATKTYTTWSFVLKAKLASLKIEVDKLDIYKLVHVPVDLIKLNDVVKNDVARNNCAW